MGVEAEEAILVDAITQYSSAAKRSGDLLQNKNFFAVAKSSITKGLQVWARLCQREILVIA